MENYKKEKNPVIKGIMALAAIVAVFIVINIGIFIVLKGKKGLSSSLSRQDKIAVIEISGIITDSADTIRQIKKYRDDKEIKGIILRINSPGGAVAPSQEIYEEVEKLKGYNKKVVVSMSTLAASGGYYIAAPADKIIANPGTITGSIGVIMSFSNMTELLKKIGMKPEVVKSGKYKDMGSPLRDMTEEDRMMFQGLIDDVYNQFVEVVAKHRKMQIDEVKKIADGRILSGRQAKEMGLVDELGNFERAVRYISDMVGIKGEPYILKEEEEKGLLYRLIKGYFPSNVFENLIFRDSAIVQYLLPY